MAVSRVQQTHKSKSKKTTPDITPTNPSRGRCATKVRLHHVGLVVNSIQEVAGNLAETLGAAWDGKVIHDPLQNVCVAFLRFPGATGPPLELVEPRGQTSPVINFLNRGGGLHHLCYEVDGLERQIEVTKSGAGIVVKTPLPAVAFGGRRIAWVYTRHKLLLEYLER